MPSALPRLGSSPVARVQASANQDLATHRRNNLHLVRGCVHALKCQGWRWLTQALSWTGCFVGEPSAGGYRNVVGPVLGEVQRLVGAVRNVPQTAVVGADGECLRSL